MSAILKRAVVGIYVDPDYFPPTINAVLTLAEKFDEVIVVCRNNTATDFPFPDNVSLKKIGKVCTVRQMEKQSVALKAFYFLRFISRLCYYSRNSRTDLLLLYDPIALYAFFVVKKFIHYKRKKVWYHNHDMPAERLSGVFSVGGLAAKNEKTALKYINILSLPSAERINCYPEINRNVSVHIIPNYPSLKMYGAVRPVPNSGETVKIIFQGFIGKGLCLESVIQLLPQKIYGKKLELILKGSVKESYRNQICEQAAKLGVLEQVKWFPIGPYRELPSLTASCDIGIGINVNTDTISKTLGTASNKIYEYAACGLPVLLYDSVDFRKYLGGYKWTFFSDGSSDSLKKNIEDLLPQLAIVGKAARESFEDHLNFETVFCPALDELIAFKKGNNPKLDE